MCGPGRQVWLERTTMQRLRELNQLSRAEAEHIHRLRYGNVITV